MINMDLLAKLLCTLLEIILCQVSLKRWLLLYNSEVAQYVLLFTPLILIFEKALFSKVVFFFIQASFRAFLTIPIKLDILYFIIKCIALIILLLCSSLFCLKTQVSQMSPQAIRKQWLKIMKNSPEESKNLKHGPNYYI